MKQLLTNPVLILMLLICPQQATWAEDDALWRQLYKAGMFAETNRAEIKYSCREIPLYSSLPKLINLCEKYELVPNKVMEDAAIPYLKKYFDLDAAHAAIEDLTKQHYIIVTKKIIASIESRDPPLLTKNEELFLWNMNNNFEYGIAINDFASDPAQGLAVAEAIINYKP